MSGGGPEPAGLPVVRAGSLAEALEAERLRSLDPVALGHFFAARRWFGGKGRRMDTVAIQDVVPAFPVGAGSVIARLRVDGAIYQVPLAVRREDAFGETPPRAVMARVVAGNEEGLLFDATEDREFRDALGESFTGGATFGDDALRWVVRPFVHGSLVGLSSRVGTAEQSNTSILFGDRAILKLYRRLEAGENPDVEIGALLTRAGFPHVPRLLGTITFEGPEVATTGGMLQELAPNVGDGWAFVLERAREELASSAAPGDFVREEMTILGRTTRDLHETLASSGDDAAFAPERASATVRSMWRDRCEEQVRTALGRLETLVREGRLAGDLVPAAERVLERSGEVLERLARIVDAIGPTAGVVIRHHGDYHLGQVLRGREGGFFVIDFEGEPARPLAERRRKDSPLRDVAGMLRSFAYAAAAAGRESPVSAERIARWELAVRTAFLDGYLERGREGGILPDGAEATARLLELFETEKLFYELAYEIGNRPDWIGIPLGGVARWIG